jgi:hypothetical protein
MRMHPPSIQDRPDTKEGSCRCLEHSQKKGSRPEIVRMSARQRARQRGVRKRRRMPIFTSDSQLEPNCSIFRWRRQCGRDRPRVIPGNGHRRLFINTQTALSSFNVGTSSRCRHSCNSSRLGNLPVFFFPFSTGQKSLAPMHSSRGGPGRSKDQMDPYLGPDVKQI